jgi:hypothetical protein
VSRCVVSVVGALCSMNPLLCCLATARCRVRWRRRVDPSLPSRRPATPQNERQSASVDGRLAALAATVERLEAALASKDAREAAMREELAQLQAAQRLSDQRTEAEIAGLSAALMALKRSLEDTARTPPAAAPSDAAASQPAPSQPASSSRDTALLLLISGGFLCVCVSVRLQCL